MDFLNKLGKKANEAYQVTKEKATEAYKVTKEKASDISEEIKLKSKINSLVIALETFKQKAYSFAFPLIFSNYNYHIYR